MPVEKTFFEQRVYEEIGLKPTKNKIKLKALYDNVEKDCDFKIFSEDDKGNIRILVYTIDRKLVQPLNKDENALHSHKNTYSQFYITRLKDIEKYTDREGNEHEKKYDIPKGAGTYPFFPPLLVEAYEKQLEINTLVLTEGYFKAFKGAMHGLPVVGLSSITHVREKDTDSMYDDVLKLIKACRVKNVIMLYDGDCRNISLKALDKGKDLFVRPAGFVQSVNKVRELFKDSNVDVYFAHVDSENIEGNPKGLDDLLIQEKDATNDIVNDLLSMSRRKTYFFSYNISNNAKKLWDYFKLNDVDVFYLHHEKFLKGKEFSFRGTKYQYNDDKGKCLITRPKEADNFFRVGDTYYEFVMIPNKYSNLERRFDIRMKSTINDDFGKNIFDHIPKYKAFCNVPNHENYSRIIHNCFNMYNEFDYVPEEGDCEESLAFMRHIFEEHYEMGMDYIQLLYQYPTQILPILCLVSKENQTGKSTFVKWLKDIFQQNMTIVGNADFSNDFNGHWVGKLIIACEESLIEKAAPMQKIKSLSTANKTSMNKKGKDQGEIDFYGKFILCSNEVEHFIYAGADDTRFWVRNIKRPAVDRTGLQDILRDEIPYFLNYLSKRELSVKKALTRAWFSNEQIRTEAFWRVVEANKPRNEREIRLWLKGLFVDFGTIDVYKGKPCVFITAKIIREQIFNNRIPLHELSRLITEHLKPEVYVNEKGDRVARRCRIPHWGKDEYENPKVCYQSEIGKPYVFYAEDYVKGADLEVLMSNFENGNVNSYQVEEVEPF